MAQATSMSGTETPVSNYPIAMGADLGIVKAQLKEHMVWMHIGSIKPDTPINVYTRFCLNTAKSKFSLVSPVADW